MKRKIFTSIGMMFLVSLISLNLMACKSEENQTVGKVRLNIETYLAGKDQPTHPSVISFDKPWNGYRYWMTYTPYPEGNGEEENPSIAVSNDLFKWKIPYGMANPIANNEETGCDELKDGHILYRSDLDRIEVWYLGRVSENLGGDGKSLTLFRKYSYDGIKWSNYEIMDTTSYLSPTIIWVENKYQMWSIGFETYDTEGTFVYQESLDGLNWTAPKKCSINNQEELELWHGAVSYDLEKQKYIFTYISTSGDSQTIEVCESEDGIHFDSAKSVVKNDKNTMWQRFYRPCILIEDGTYHLFYGVITEDNKWYISYSYGEDLSKLRGISEKDSSKMNSLNSNVINTKSLVYKIKEVYHSFCDFFRPEIIVFTVILLLLYNIICKQKNYKRKFLEYGVCVLLCVGYTFFRLRPRGILNIFSAFGIGIFESICSSCITWTLVRNVDFIVKNAKKSKKIEE